MLRQLLLLTINNLRHDRSVNIAVRRPTHGGEQLASRHTRGQRYGQNQQQRQPTRNEPRGRQRLYCLLLSDGRRQQGLVME